MSWDLAELRAWREMGGDLCSRVLRGAECGHGGTQGLWKAGAAWGGTWGGSPGTDPKRGGSPPNSPGQRVKLWEQSRGWHAVDTLGIRWPSREVARGPREDAGAGAGDSWGTGRRAGGLAEIQAPML